LNGCSVPSILTPLSFAGTSREPAARPKARG
jgi:hypothetical protein